jgi:hypothetical protein
MLPSFALSRILLIRPDISSSVYRDAFLKQCGFLVEIAIPSEVQEIVNSGIASYSAVVISGNLAPEDVLEVTGCIRQSSPQTKIVLIEGPDLPCFDPSFYDALVGSWSGPIALVDAVHRLVAN